jgi:hypothetical protein
MLIEANSSMAVNATRLRRGLHGPLVGSVIIEVSS